MTMPRTAEFAKQLGRSPKEWSDKEIDVALRSLSVDLPGNPIAYVMDALPDSERCECGALHLSVSAADLDDETRSSLHRLLATPFGDIVREYVTRRSDVTNVRFGWNGLETRLPEFVQAVDLHDARHSYASELSETALSDIMTAIRLDLPGMMRMVDRSLSDFAVYAVSPQPDDEDRREWKQLIDQVMVAFSTPVRKYLDEHAARRYKGASVGAVNCCIVMSSRLSGESWQKRWFGEQVNQQLTPDC